MKNRSEETQVLLYRQILIEREASGHIPYPLADSLIIFHRIQPAYRSLAFIGKQQGGKNTEQRRFPRTVRADDTKKFPQPATAPDGLANALPDVPVCDPDCHGEPDIVARLRSDLPDDEVLYDLSELFRVFGDTTRIKILYALFESELCVGDLAQLLDVSQSAVSHQLRLLKASKLVKFRRDGKTVFYSLDDDHVRSMIALGMEHVEE